MSVPEISPNLTIHPYLNTQHNAQVRELAAKKAQADFREQCPFRPDTAGSKRSLYLALGSERARSAGRERPRAVRGVIAWRENAPLLSLLAALWGFHSLCLCHFLVSHHNWHRLPHTALSSHPRIPACPIRGYSHLQASAERPRAPPPSELFAADPGAVLEKIQQYKLARNIALLIS